MRSPLLRALGLGALLVLLTAAGANTFFPYAHAQSISPDASPLEPAAEAAGAWLGLEVAPLSERLATRLGIPNEGFVVVLRAVRDGPAARAGIQARDVITAVDDAAIDGVAALRREVDKHTAGDTIRLTILRAGNSTDVDVEAQSAPERPATRPRWQRGPGHGMPDLWRRGPAYGMPGWMLGGFEDQISTQRTYKGKNGQVVTARSAFGRIVSASDSSVTLNLNGGGQETLTIGPNTRMRGRGSDLKAGDKVVALTQDGSKELQALMVWPQDRHGPGRAGDRRPWRVQALDGFPAVGLSGALDRMPSVRDQLESHVYDAVDPFALERVY